MIKTPVNQVRLTNIAIVRLKRAGKRFEIACYPNKVVQWKQNIEKDIDEVIQAHTVFANVSKGSLAKKGDLVKAFGTDDQTEICKQILQKGDLQISEKEREVQYDSLFRDIASIVADKSINTTNNRPFTVGMIEQAMKDVHFAVKPSKSAKQQALELMRLLKETLPIARARMRTKITIPATAVPDLNSKIEGMDMQLEKETAKGTDTILVHLIDPSCFRSLEALVRQINQDSPDQTPGQFELLNTHVHEESDTKLEQVDSFASSVAPKVVQAVDTKPKAQFMCRLCGDLEFGNATDHRNHFKSDLHKYNLKQKSKGQEPISQSQYDEISIHMSGMAVDADDIYA